MPTKTIQKVVFYWRLCQFSWHNEYR